MRSVSPLGALSFPPVDKSAQTCSSAGGFALQSPQPGALQAARNIPESEALRSELVVLLKLKSFQESRSFSGEQTTSFPKVEGDEDRRLRRRADEVTEKTLM